MLYLINDDTEVVSECLGDLETGEPCLKLSIKDGKRVKIPGKLFVAGNFTDNRWTHDESEAWEYVERIAAMKAGAKDVK
jgi:hypothetical protein